MTNDKDDRESSTDDNRGRIAGAGRGLAEQATRHAQRGIQAIGEGLDRAADYVEREAERRSVPGVKPEQVAAVAGELHNAAGYLQSAPPGQMLSDLDAAVRRHPYRAVAIGLGLGWVIGRLSRR